MDISGLLSTFISKDQLEGIAKEANVSTDGTTKILSCAATMFANRAADGSVTSSVLESLKGSTDVGKLISSLLGGNALKELSERSHFSETDSGSVLTAAAPMIMNALNASDSADQNKLLGMVKIFADNKKSSGIFGFLGSLFGKK